MESIAPKREQADSALQPTNTKVKEEETMKKDNSAKEASKIIPFLDVSSSYSYSYSDEEEEDVKAGKSSSSTDKGFDVEEVKEGTLSASIGKEVLQIGNSLTTKIISEEATPAHLEEAAKRLNTMVDIMRAGK